MGMHLDLLNDDLLELILLRLDSPICLVGAAAVCKRWRRVIAGDGGAFLRRIRSLQRPPNPIVYGHYSSGNYVSYDSYRHQQMGDKLVPFFLPTPASIATGIGENRHFSPDFLDSYDEIIDSCGSLLLLRKHKHSFLGITVYEPLTRQCRIVNPVTLPPDLQYYTIWCAYLLPGDDADATNASMSNFRVVCTFHDIRDRDLHAGVLMVSGHNGVDIIPGQITRLERNQYPMMIEEYFIGRAGASLHWVNNDGVIHVLDGITMETSSFMFPDMAMWNSSTGRYFGVGRQRSRAIRVVDCGGGAARIVCFAGHDHVVVFARPARGEWALEKSFRLQEWQWQEGYYCRFLSKFASMVAAGEGFVLFAPTEFCQWVFHIDLETEVITLKLNGGIYSAGLLFPCELPWPPHIRACVEHANGN
uniref:F-box domain-containing protein n=1 Tax=Leersia perrieri TaxID=77586 RepID=A0A0D9VUN8_9ORYZ